MILSFLSCSKKQKTAENSLSATAEKNRLIEKQNDSIRIINETNRFADWSGEHKLTHNNIDKNGTIKFNKTGRDEYLVSGEISSGKNSLKINGTMHQISEKFMNMDGEIIQNITADGAEFKRSDRNTFKKENGFWRLQNKTNAAGFVDYIDIY